MTPSFDPASPKAIAFGDLDRELATTRRVLERLPEEHYSWKPHEKSMSLGRLALHVANLLYWQLVTLQSDEFDLASPPPLRVDPTSREEVLRTFDQNAAAVKAALGRIDDAALGRTWTLRQGEKVLVRQPRAMTLRVWGLNHLIHHRGQLCLYLRLLNVPVPAVYFNSADEPEWVFT
jgi:uncharacterized damage-inducible protein DinB